MSDKVPVTQEDREAAASGYLVWISSNRVIPTKMREGRVDDHSMVQAFARHSVATREQALREALQAAYSVSGFTASGAIEHGPTSLGKVREILRALIPTSEGGR